MASFVDYVILSPGKVSLAGAQVEFGTLAYACRAWQDEVFVAVKLQYLEFSAFPATKVRPCQWAKVLQYIRKPEGFGRS